MWSKSWQLGRISCAQCSAFDWYVSERKSHLTLSLHQKLLHWTFVIKCDNFHGCFRWEEDDFTHSKSPWLWVASMKLVPGSSVKLKDKKYRCQFEDSLGAMCYYRWSDDQGNRAVQWLSEMQHLISYISICLPSVDSKSKHRPENWIS